MAGNCQKLNYNQTKTNNQLNPNVYFNSIQIGQPQGIDYSAYGHHCWCLVHPSQHRQSPPCSNKTGYYSFNRTLLPISKVGDEGSQAHQVNSKPFVESEDDEDIIVQLTAGSHLEVIKSPISCLEATTTFGSCLEVVKSSDNTSSASDDEPPVIPTFDITISYPNNSCHYCVKKDWPYVTHLDKRTPALAPFNAPSACTSCTLAILTVTTPKVQSYGHSKTITAKRVEDGSTMPEGSQSFGEIVVPDHLGNLFPEYNSADEEMDVEVKVEPSGEEVEMAT
ncbi:hypothetical protein EDD22DRAFT_845774 [Suillus occidentalis]|nr:hypothetical protein EDD22DRAFT_845774 [Suillus occidentalis]